MSALDCDGVELVIVDKDICFFLADETQVGSHSLIFNDEDVVPLLRAAVEREENQGAFARRHGLERTHLNQVLKRKKSVSGTILTALGLRKVYAPE